MADWITEQELCEWLRIQRMTAYRWRKKGLPYMGKQKCIRYNKEEVEQWLRDLAKGNERRGNYGKA